MENINKITLIKHFQHQFALSFHWEMPRLHLNNSGIRELVRNFF